MVKTHYLGLILLIAPSVMAQRNNNGLPPVRPIPPLGTPGAGFRTGPRPGFFRSAPFAYPLYFGDYGYDYPVAPAPAPTVVIVQQPSPQYVVVPQLVSEAPRLEVHEYIRAPSNAPPPREDESAAFVIVLKDGSVRSAVAVAVQDDVVHYVEPDGRHRRVALDAVDRDATIRRNRELNLQLQLPASDH
ncbi:MAG TPA: hypothetical protein VEV17_17165 [Bryobacteraceae bacterium]|nr:hypothetical protein [Bryobacteraceae bacterium]